MQIEIKIHKDYVEPKITIMTAEVTDEINEIAKKISEKPPSVLTGFKDDEVVILEPRKIIHIYASDQKVHAVTDDGDYVIRLRIYEAYERLRTLEFVRISNSEIINLKKVKGFDLSFAGTICVNLTNGVTTYVSRRYVAKIKQVLGI